MAYKKDRLGECYTLAGIAVSDMMFPDAVLIHGTIGIDNPHAWVEFKDPDMVIERNGIVYYDGTLWWEPVSEYLMPPEALTSIFHNVEHYRYTYEDVLKMGLKYKHWGPWDGDYWKVVKIGRKKKVKPVNWIDTIQN